MLIIDYFGLWSEAPAEHALITSASMDRVVTYLRDGLPVTVVRFEPD